MNKNGSSSYLFYVIGPSGAGKDSVIGYARQHIHPSIPVVFAHRYITRAADAGGENHIHLTVQEFMIRKNYGLFAMDWESHGFYYGIGKEILMYLGAGLSVIINGSRNYLPQAMTIYPFFVPVLVVTEKQILYERLKKRGRETELEIYERIERSRKFTDGLHHIAPNITILQNNGPLEESGENFLNIILSKTI